MAEPDEIPVQTERPARLTLRGFGESVERELFDLDRGMLGTWLQLWRRPGTTLRRYVEWRDPRLTPPVRYAIVCLALSTLLLQWFGITPDYKAGLLQGFAEGNEGEETPAWIALVSEHLHWWLYLVALPAMAAALESSYRTRINLAEALAFATYSLAQISLGFALLLIVLSQVLGDLDVLPLLLWPIYFAVACYGYFKPQHEGLGRALSATMLMLAFLLLFTISLVFIAVAAGRLLS